MNMRKQIIQISIKVAVIVSSIRILMVKLFITSVMDEQSWLKRGVSVTPCVSTHISLILYVDKYDWNSVVFENSSLWYTYNFVYFISFIAHDLKMVFANE